MELIEKIREKLRTEFCDENEKINIQPNLYKGWDIQIISPRFHNTSFDRRKEEIIKVLNAAAIKEKDIDFQFMELVTPEEYELFGTDFKDLRPEDLPFWPETVATLQQKKEILSIEDTDESIEPPLIAAFYSFKGGVGRTTALAYTAHILASQGYRVITMDFDLEAPGLIHIFGQKDVSNNLQPSKTSLGILDLLTQFYDNGQKIDIFPYLHPVKTSGKGEVFCFSAGQLNQTYIQQLFSLDFQDFYRKHVNPLHEIINSLKKTIKPHVILIDARTGLSEINAPLLLDLNDIGIIFYYPHPQTKPGFDLLTRTILARKNMRGFTPELRFVITPVPPSDKGQIYRKGLEWIHEFVDYIKSLKADENYFTFTSEDICQEIRYQERIAFSDRLLFEDNDIISTYRPLGDWLIKYLPDPKKEEIFQSTPDILKERVLNDLNFETGIAEEQENLSNFFVRTEDFNRAKSKEIVLVIGRKGTGKTAIYRMLSENVKHLYQPVIIQAPKTWEFLMLDRDGFKAIERLLKQYDLDWEVFWSCYILLIIYRKTKIRDNSIFANVAQKFEKSQGKTVMLVDALKQLLKKSSIALLAKDKFRFIDEKFSNQPRCLFFDGLDTSFGSLEADLKRRKKALEGLFSLWYEIQELENISWKIFLRQDIWESLTFQNKSHLYGKYLTLKWSKVDFFKTIVKQALASQFKIYAEKRLNIELSEEIEHWPEDRLNKVMFQLISERMRGGRTAFTTNWIWNRLADGNGDHSPRYLFQLFREANQWERDEQKRNPYERSIIRPRALIQVYHVVSNESVNALREEYPQLHSLIDWLRNQRSPLDLKEIPASINEKDGIKLAQDIGLLKIYEESEGEIRRIAVPDLYLKGLNMTRKGQA